MTDMNRIPICERLRELGGEDRPTSHQMPTCTEAAKLIESLVSIAFPALIYIFECSDDDNSSRVAKEAADKIEHLLSQAHTEVLLDEQRDRANAADAAPRHSVFDPSHSSVSRPSGECRLSQGEE
jgi:hypothetical protein